MPEYRFICILDSVERQRLSRFDVSPDYLHIHILDRKYLSSLDSFSESLSDEKSDGFLYQWGVISQKGDKTRTGTVDSKTIKQMGHIGIGSAAKGSEQKGDFQGGGEGFLFDEQNFRITRGNSVFEVSDDQQYWTFQVINFNGAQKCSDLKGSIVNGRQELMKLLKDKSGDGPLVAVFDAEFKGEFYARSNGIFEQDYDHVANPQQAVFESEIKGGHLLGGSDNKGDIESLKLLKEKNPESRDPEDINFSIQINSNVLLQEVKKVLIAEQENATELSDFRGPELSPDTNFSAKGGMQLASNHKTNVREK